MSAPDCKCEANHWSFFCQLSLGFPTLTKALMCFFPKVAAVSQEMAKMQEKVEEATRCALQLGGSAILLLGFVVHALGRSLL